MNDYDWYLIFNLTDFLALDLVSKTYSKELQDKGLTDFLVTKGNTVGVTIDGVFLAINMADQNGFNFEERSIYLDNETQDVYVGFKNAG